MTAITTAAAAGLAERSLAVLPDILGKCIKMELLLRKLGTHRWVCTFERLHKLLIFEIVCYLLSNSLKNFFAVRLGQLAVIKC